MITKWRSLSHIQFKPFFSHVMWLVYDVKFGNMILPSKKLQRNSKLNHIFLLLFFNTGSKDLSESFCLILWILRNHVLFGYFKSENISLNKFSISKSDIFRKFIMRRYIFIKKTQIFHFSPTSWMYCQKSENWSLLAEYCI